MSSCIPFFVVSSDSKLYHVSTHSYVSYIMTDVVGSIGLTPYFIFQTSGLF